MFGLLQDVFYEVSNLIEDGVSTINGKLTEATIDDMIKMKQLKKSATFDCTIFEMDNSDSFIEYDTMLSTVDNIISEAKESYHNSTKDIDVIVESDEIEILPNIEAFDLEKYKDEQDEEYRVRIEKEEDELTAKITEAALELFTEDEIRFIMDRHKREVHDRLTRI